jgi:predicted amidohydrolase
LIAANTVVLKDVEFQGNDVTLRSRTGFVAAMPGTGKVVSPGQINFVSGVYYNNTEVKLPGMTAAQGHTEFHNAAAANHADHGGVKSFPGLKIQTLGGVTH